MLADTARGQVHALDDGAFDRLGLDLTGAVGVNIDRQRLGHADGIADLQRAAVGQPGSHHVFRQIARSISRRAVNLGRVLARKRTATVGGRAAIGVDNDLAPRQARIAIRPTDHEGAGRVDPPFGFLGDPARGQDLADVGLDNRADCV